MIYIEMAGLEITNLLTHSKERIAQIIHKKYRRGYNNKMIKILYVTSAIDGGVGAIVYNYCVNMTDNIVFDFISYSKSEGVLEKSLCDLGFNTYHVTPLSVDYKKSLRELKNVIHNGQYDVVHTHQGYRGLFPLFYAKKYGVKVRIAHSHTSAEILSVFKTIRRICVICLVKMLATDLFACGKDAGIWMWGKRLYENGEVYIVPNAINIKSLHFSKTIRCSLREKLKLEDKFVIGHVGRFSYEKNHEFIVNVFSKVKKVHTNAVLMLVGQGDDEEKIRKMVQEVYLENSIIFMGYRDDVSMLLNAMDVLVLPSLYEGLPITLIEAQANGLPALVSDRITKEIQITDIIKYLPIDKGEGIWVEALAEVSESCENRSKYHDIVVDNWYDISTETKKLEQKYYECLKR